MRMIYTHKLQRIVCRIVTLESQNCQHLKTQTVNTCQPKLSTGKRRVHGQQRGMVSTPVNQKCQHLST